MIKKEWKVYSCDSAKPLIERLLLARGIKGEENVKEFLDPYSLTLIHPNAFNDMQKSVDRIQKAINEKEKILIYGDFDADGITSTSLLVKTFNHLGADVDYYIPERETDGHGLNSNALVKLMVKVKPKLIITVDCGISNIEEVNFINSFKKDVIITDHHESGDVLPEAFGIINPKAQNSLNEALGAKEINYLTSLAGVGVAFKLAQAVLERFGKIDYSNEILPFVAVGTIADIVPLIGENRYYVLKGLDLISKGKHYGLKRVLESAGYNNVESGITSEQISFGVAPRINACGRLGTVKEAMDVMISDNKQAIELSVLALDNYNKIRQELCNKIFLEADKMAEKVRDNILVLYKEDWHVGIIGIVASKLVEKYGKPTFLMTYSEETGQIKCSARGVEGIEELNLHDMIENISDLLDGFGGHALAAGLYFSPEKSSFEKVKSALIKSYNEITESRQLTPVINIDLELTPDEITEDLIKDISKLEPFGASNPPPMFSISGLILKEKKLMGSNKEHLKLIVEKDGRIFNSIWWSFGDIGLNAGDSLDIVFSPQLNTFNGVTSVQLIIKDLHSDCIVEPETAKVITYDNRKKTDILDKVDMYLKNAKFDFCVFAEKNSVKEKLKSYPEIYSRIVDRNNLKQTDGVMFFDYPPTEEIMANVLHTINPVRIHYMAYDVEGEREFDYFKTLSGMIKYVAHSKEGRFNLQDGACFLGLTPSVVEVMLEMFEDCGSIKILERSEEYFVIEYKNQVNPESLKSCENYSVFTSMLDDIFKQRQEFLEMEI